MTEADDKAAAKKGIDASIDYFKEIGAPVTLTQAVGAVSDSDIDELADICTYRGTRTIGTFKVLDGEGIKAIYKLAL